MQRCDKKLQVQTTRLLSLDRLKILAIAVAIFIFVVEIVTNIIRNIFLDLTELTTAISAIFVIVIEAIFGVFFAVAGGRIIRILGNGNTQLGFSSLIQGGEETFCNQNLLGIN